MFYKLDEAAVGFMNEAEKIMPLSILVGKEIETRTVGVCQFKVPLKRSLKKFGIKVVAFREPVKGEVFISARGPLYNTYEALNPMWNKHRFIVERI